MPTLVLGQGRRRARGRARRGLRYGGARSGDSTSRLREGGAGDSRSRGHHGAVQGGRVEDGVAANGDDGRANRRHGCQSMELAAAHPWRTSGRKARSGLATG